MFAGRRGLFLHEGIANITDRIVFRVQITAAGEVVGAARTGVCLGIGPWRRCATKTQVTTLPTSIPLW